MANPRNDAERDADQASRSPEDQSVGQLPRSEDRRSWDPGNYSDTGGEDAAEDDTGRWKRGSGYYGSRGQTEPEREEDAAPVREGAQDDLKVESGSAGAFSEGAFRTAAPPPESKPVSQPGNVSPDDPNPCGDRTGVKKTRPGD